MAIPEGVERITVNSGNGLTLPDGTPLQGTIMFEAPALNAIADDDYVFGSRSTVTLNPQGDFSVDLIPSDAEGIDPSGWTYTVTTRFRNARDWTQFILITKDMPSPVALSDILQPEQIDPNFDRETLKLAGGTMTGPLFLAAEPTQPLEAATKQYTDDGDDAVAAIAQSYTDTRVGTRLPLAGGTLTGPVGFTTGGVDVDLQRALAATLSTGVASGGILSPNASDPRAVDVSALTGFIVDTYTDPAQPTATFITQPDRTVELEPDALTRSVTWFSLLADGQIVQSDEQPSIDRYQSELVLGAIVYDPFSDQIIVFESLPTVLPQTGNQITRLLDSLGPFRIQGLIVGPNGANLQVDLSAGEFFARSFNHADINQQLTRDPHVVTINNRTAFVFRHITRELTTTPPLVDTVDPTQWDNNGTLQNVGGGNNTSTVMTWMIAGSTGPVLQFGQATYGSLDSAVEAIGRTPKVVDPLIRRNAVVLGHMAVIRTATDLSDPTQAVFVPADKFTSA